MMQKTFNDRDLIFIHKETGLQISLEEIKIKKEDDEKVLGISYIPPNSFLEDVRPLTWRYNIEDIVFSNDFIRVVKNEIDCVIQQCYNCGRYHLLTYNNNKKCECGYNIPF